MAEPSRIEVVVDRLRAAGCVAAEEEAAELLAADPDDRTLEMWLRRREQGEPLAWIVRATTFGGLRLAIRPGVYVPRPQSEVLAHRAAAALPPGGRAVDVGTGSGAVAAVLAATVPTALVVGIDLSPVAVACARTNGVQALVADLAALPLGPASVDLVTSVAPYVPTDALRLLPADVQRHEPRTALDGGPDGLDLVRTVVRSAATVLRPGGRLLVEVGGDQDDRLAPDLAEAGFGAVVTWTDDDGDLRGLEATRAG
ncbi:peptide chain release factor N(5)-glutamine methyltransferase [Iamia sp. SCSIO 61187]|uniref:N5-glutamine methyltransferase family protein n=1 Tax=Iamia sp. SCSIO 61187 TaxID=2722752 RepID=UPI001C633B72|nr:HemK/PrmC family methyltransferase [Iamia sp. SCSIO 61187]QYG95168.1 peptide chain release factor N(5)-glutamine methyltransferase [Iamia sp. SCSIO 61187]